MELNTLQNFGLWILSTLLRYMLMSDSEEANGEKCKWERKKVVSGKFLRLKIRIRGKVDSLRDDDDDRESLGGIHLRAAAANNAHWCTAVLMRFSHRVKKDEKFIQSFSLKFSRICGELWAKCHSGRCDANFVRPRAILRDKYRSELCTTCHILATGHPICVLVQLSTAVVGMKIGFFLSSSALILLISNSSVALMHVRRHDWWLWWWWWEQGRWGGNENDMKISFIRFKAHTEKRWNLPYLELI